MICSRSKFARYSSRESQKAAWKQYYKYECKAHEKYSPKVPPTLLRLAARLLWRAEEEFQSKPADQATLPTTKYDFHAWQTLFKGFDECTTSQRIAFGQVPISYRVWRSQASCTLGASLLSSCPHLQMAMLCFMFFRAGEKRRPEEDGSWSMGLPAMPPAHCRGGYTWPAPDIPAIHAGEIQHLLSALSVNCHTVCGEKLARPSLLMPFSMYETAFWPCDTKKPCWSLLLTPCCLGSLCRR